MSLAVTFGPQALSFRRTLDFAGIYDDPRGLTGSEYGVVRFAEEAAKLGHDVTLFTESSDTEWNGVKIRPLAERTADEFDAAISWSEPDTLRGVKAKVRVLYNMLAKWSHVQPGFDEHFDLGVAVAPAQYEKIINEWHDVGMDANGQPLGQYHADPARWTVVPLGCDPDRLCERREVSTAEATYLEPHWPKVPGKVIYCSSPDRGLQYLLQEWAHIKAAVPHATLHIYYRLGPLLRTFDNVPHFPPIEPNRAITTYIEEALRRYAAVGGMGITVHDSVSRNEMQREMMSAEVLAYPCRTIAWSEDFSCSILECCAARACPITTNCDGLGSVYGEVLPLTPLLDPTEWAGGEIRADGAGHGWVERWRDNVVRALTDAEFRQKTNDAARAFAELRTWRATTEKLLGEIEKRMAR